jgi:hypothetical protein
VSNIKPGAPVSSPRSAMALICPKEENLQGLYSLICTQELLLKEYCNHEKKKLTESEKGKKQQTTMEG